MPRFVILEHDHPQLHWDLMLERAGRLRTWRLDQAPRSNCCLQATAIGDHRLAYLDYEGPVSNKRGNVKRVEAGTYTGNVEGKELIEVQINGVRLIGTLRLEHRLGDLWIGDFVSDKS